MNERIRELADEAAEFIEAGSGSWTSDIFEQKFAELIVQECAKVCNDVSVAIFAESVQNNFGAAQTCKIAIEKHFGVEE